MVVRISKEFIGSIFTQVSCTYISFCDARHTVTMELHQKYICTILFVTSACHIVCTFKNIQDFKKLFNHNMLKSTN